MVLAGNFSRSGTFESWSGALAEAVEVDLCAVAEARGWTKWKAVDFFSDSGVRSVPMKSLQGAA